MKHIARLSMCGDSLHPGATPTNAPMLSHTHEGQTNNSPGIYLDGHGKIWKFSEVFVMERKKSYTIHGFPRDVR